MKKSKDLKVKTEHEIEKNKLKEKITFEKVFKFLETKKNKVLDGYKNGYELALNLKKLEIEIEKIKNEIRKTVCNEVDGGYEWSGYKFETTASGRYNYSESEKWNDINDKKKALEKDMKYSFKTGKIMFDKETGEEIISANYKPNKTSYKISKIK